MKACKAACIGCGKCEKDCKFEAITIVNNLSYIDSDKCRLCRKCVEACPTHAIVAVNFPAPRPKTDTGMTGNRTKTSEEANVELKQEEVKA